MSLWFSGKPLFYYVIFIVSQWLAMIIESSFAVYKNPYSIDAIRRSFQPLNSLQKKLSTYRCRASLRSAAFPTLKMLPKTDFTR